MDNKPVRTAWRWLLLIPFIATLYPPFFASATPSLAGFPFFYWYLLLWVVLVGILTGIVYWITRPRDEQG
jgi:hypothetical protein